VSSPAALVIVPTYNERENLPILIGQLLAYENVNVLVVDDQSPDGTGAIADDLARQHPGRMQVMHRTGRRGLGRSYVDGFKAALASHADVVCQMDADLSHDPAYLPSLIAAAERADLILGSRYVEHGAIVNWPLRRLLLSRFANLYIRLVTRLQVRDCTTGYRCWRRAALAELPLDRISSDGYSFLVETLYMAAQRKAKLAEVPITFVERRLGQSKMSRAVIFESMLMPWRLIGAQDHEGA
jgi:dolichol-phosphate mannosyltransferase